MRSSSHDSFRSIALTFNREEDKEEEEEERRRRMREGEEWRRGVEERSRGER